MAQKTTLGVLGLPGPIRVFVAKDPAPGGGPHNPGHITALTVYGVPGRLQAFTPKVPSIGGPHDPGRITALMVYGLPGRTQSFVAKSEPPIVPPVRRQFFRIKRTSRREWREYYIVEED